MIKKTREKDFFLRDLFITLRDRIQENTKKVKLKALWPLSFFLLFLLVVAGIYSFVSIMQHNRFMTFGLDLGYFDEVIWKISRGKFPYSGVGCIWLLEDHFQPILYLFAPLYWIWNDARVLLIVQSFVMVFAALPLYLIAKKLTNLFFSFSVSFSYLFFIGTQFAILNEFHQVTIAPIFIGLIFYALLNKRNRLFYLGILGLLLIKEDLSLLITGIGVGLCFKKNTRTLGVITALLGISAFFFLIYIFMPAISVKGIYSHLSLGPDGLTPVDMVFKIIKDPLFFVRSMVYPPVKLKTIFQSFFTFGFLPILAPFFVLIPLAQDFIVRFIYSGPQVTKWALVNHHGAVSSILLAVATIYGAKNIRIRLFKKSKKNYYMILGLIIVFTTILQDYIFTAPVNSVFKRAFYFEQDWVRDNREVLLHVPKNASVAAQNNLLPHLTHRDNIYRIPYGLNSKYMVVDLQNGPNKYAPLTYNQMSLFVENLLADKRYSIVYQKGEAMLLKRNFKTDITKSKYYKDERFCYYSFEER